VPNLRQYYVEEFVMFNHISCPLWVLFGKDVAHLNRNLHNAIFQAFIETH